MKVAQAVLLFFFVSGTVEAIPVPYQPIQPNIPMQPFAPTQSFAPYTPSTTVSVRVRVTPTQIPYSPCGGYGCSQMPRPIPMGSHGGYMGGAGGYGNRIAGPSCRTRGFFARPCRAARARMCCGRRGRRNFALTINTPGFRMGLFF